MLLWNRNVILAISTVLLDLAAGSQLSIVGEPKSVHLLDGESVELSCEAFGTPVPTIQWLHDGKVLSLESPTNNAQQQQKKDDILASPVLAERISNHGIRTFQMSTTSSKIHIPCVNKEKAGLYSCVANNGRETVTANATVRLNENSNLLWFGSECQVKRTEGKGAQEAAQIYMWTDSRMERPGVSVQLMCRATGKPTPKIVWYEVEGEGESSRLELIKQDDPRYSLLRNGDLLVKETPIDVPVSMFQCKAINENGQDSVASMLLEILDDTKEEGSDETENAIKLIGDVPAGDLQLPL